MTYIHISFLIPWFTHLTRRLSTARTSCASFMFDALSRASTWSKLPLKQTSEALPRKCLCAVSRMTPNIRNRWSGNTETINRHSCPPRVNRIGAMIQRCPLTLAGCGYQSRLPHVANPTKTSPLNLTDPEARRSADPLTHEKYYNDLQPFRTL